jgi:hypothetical protein
MSDQSIRRTLIIVTRRGPTGPVLVAASLLAASACSPDVEVDGSSAAVAGSGGSGSTTTSVTATSGQGGAGGQPATGSSSSLISSSGAGGGPMCPWGEDKFIVTIPPEGVPASAGDICGTMGMMPVESNTAARVTLAKDPQNLAHATGQVTIDPALLPEVVGLPTIEVVSSPIPQMMSMAATNVTPNATGFAFEANWPMLQLSPDPSATMIVRTTFDLTCAPKTRQVQAHTHINLCNGSTDYVWVSSGDECTICGVIAEMAPSPIVPDKTADEIGLGRVIRLRLVILAAIGDSLLIWAEHDAGSDVEYHWRVQAGEVRTIAPDVALWTPPVEGGPHALQVAVVSDEGAAVASYNDVPIREAGLVA